MKAKSKINEEIHFQITEEDYQQMIAEGADSEHAPKPGNYVGKRGGLRKKYPRAEIKEALKPENTKVRITMYVDLDILNFFKGRAAEANAAPYQTQMNNALRAFINGQADDRQALLNDEDFIKRLAEKVAAHQKSKPKARHTNRAA